MESKTEPFAARQAMHYRPASRESEVIVPLALSIITGVFLTLIALWLWLEIDLPLETAGFAFLIGFGGIWVWRLWGHDRMLMAAEEFTQRDLDGDNTIGQRPEPEAHSLHIDLTLHRQGRNPQLRRFDLPCDLETLVEIADVMLAGSVLPESEWAGLRQGRPFSEAGLKKFKDALVANDLAIWLSPQNPRLGIVLTEAGKTFMREVTDQSLADDDATPPLQ